MKSLPSIEELREKYIAFRDGPEREYTRFFPRPKRVVPESSVAVDPITFAVVKARVDGIINEMTEVVLRTSRNPILYAAKDFTCTLLSHDCRLLSMANSLPGHVMGADAPLWAIVHAFKDDIQPGDAFINNDVYYGDTHVGDFQMYIPVFYEGMLVAWAHSLCHLIDSGAYLPTNLDPTAKDVYEEGIHIPPMRVARKNAEVPEMIRFFRANFRYPDEWYGDFLAQFGAVQKGAERIFELCEKYGAEDFIACQDQMIAYGDQRMRTEIERMPRGVWCAEGLSEKLPLAPEGLMFRVTMGIDPDSAEVFFDLTEMPDQLPWGLNQSWATARIACLQGAMPAFDPTIPRNVGVYDHFKIILRHGALGGMPKWPAATCCATTNLTDEISNVVGCMMEQVASGLGHGGNGELNASLSVGSGVDFRNNRAYGHMYFLATSSGGACAGNDGWPTQMNNSIQGNCLLESVELTELKIPNIIWEIGIQTDGGGAGKWRGGTGFFHRIQPRVLPETFIPFATGHTCAPEGIAGGSNGALAHHWIAKHDDSTAPLKHLTNTGAFTVEADEEWVARTNGGGGYGDPLERDTQLVASDVRDGFISKAAAREIYGVALRYEMNGDPVVDKRETGLLRQAMKHGEKGE